MGQAPHDGRRRSDRRRKHHYVRGWTRLELSGEYPLHSSELSTDKGVVVSVHLDCPPEAVGEASLSCFKRFGAFIGGRVKKEQMTSYAAVDLIAQRTANTHTQQRHPRHGGWWGVAVVLVVGRSVSARYTSPARARIAIASCFCFVFRLSKLVTSSYGGTSAFAFLVAWFPFRW